jgi:ribosomal protein S18 acetylase RimI-like enzyme
MWLNRIIADAPIEIGEPGLPDPSPAAASVEDVSTQTTTLDDPVGASLAGAHAGFAVRQGSVARYAPDVAPFASLGGPPEREGWADFATVGAGVLLLDPDQPMDLPDGWRTTWKQRGVQMVDTGMTAEPDEEAVRLTVADVPDMLNLIGRTRPGPFLLRTVELGSYLGIRRQGKLLAMAGERMRPPGYTEISAVCTDPDYRGSGLASRLMRAVASGVRARGDIPILHASSTNSTAIRLYERLGFVVRREFDFVGLELPTR